MVPKNLEGSHRGKGRYEMNDSQLPLFGEGSNPPLPPAYPDRAAWGTAPKLRAWQAEAMTKYFTENPRDFMAVATPGAGKTTFALTVAKELFNRGTINRMTVVAPTDHLKRQWADAAARVGISIDPNFKNSDGTMGRGYQGVALTYAQVANKPMLHRARTENGRTLVIMDEIHHAGDSLSWGDGLREAFEPATRRLALTGTPFRSDTAAIPFVQYEEDADGIRRSKSDYSYGYGPALKDHVVRPVIFMAYSGQNGEGVNFASMMLAAGVCLSLTAQIAENIDYLRFMPPKTPKNKRSWWTAVILGGPGWVFLGAAKQIIGVFLAVYIIANLNQSTDMAMEPVNQFLSMYKEMMPGWLAVALAVFLVVVSQIKINVTNAYSGSLAWTNIYSRTFKRYPGRITFVVLNVGIALALMEFNMFQVLGFVLSFYSNFAIAWIFTVAADIVFNKYLLKLSPLEPEFRRGMLYNVNPVGVVSVLAAGGISVAMFFGAFGDGIAAFSPLFSAIIAVIVTPLMAVITKGRYYLRRSHDGIDVPMFDEHGNPSDHKLTCAITGEEVERPDMVASAKTGPNGETLYVSSLALTLDTTGEHVLPADNNVVRRRTPRRRTVE